MKGRSRYALAIVAFVAAVLASGGWLAQTALRLERAELEARERAQREEYVRLALWRMESAITPILGVENARPASDYQVFFRAEEGGVLFASPLLSETPPHVELHFQIDERGNITSPQVPMGEERELARGRFTRDENIERSAKDLARLKKLVTRAALDTVLPKELRPTARRFEATTRGPDRTEYVWRERAVGTSYSYGAPARERVAVPKPGETRTLQLAEQTRATTAITPVWIGRELLLVRRARSQESDHIQGVWLAWDELSSTLRGSIGDLFASSSLEPLGANDANGAWRLASLPVALVPGATKAPLERAQSSLRFPLTVAWAALAFAALAMLALVIGVLRLGERRAAFVSAVTHELRTPLTTLQTYAEMLRDGKIRDTDKTQQYLDTMHREALRLARLVDNVLAYSRIERSRSTRRERVLLNALLANMRDSLCERAAAAGMTLDLDIPNGVAVTADPLALERILDNLVDNACKYGSGTVHLAVRTQGRHAFVRIADEGPGIDPDVRLFVPFARSAERAAGSAPGVGLGLTLCRRLARAMHGDILHVPTRTGATFDIRLPLAT